MTDAVKKGQEQARYGTVVLGTACTVDLRAE